MQTTDNNNYLYPSNSDLLKTIGQHIIDFSNLLWGHSVAGAAFGRGTFLPDLFKRDPIQVYWACHPDPEGQV